MCIEDGVDGCESCMELIADDVLATVLGYSKNPGLAIADKMRNTSKGIRVGKRCPARRAAECIAEVGKSAN